MNPSEIEQLSKTEKTYIGTKVEIVVQAEFGLQRGRRMDYSIVNEEVDAKWSMKSGGPTVVDLFAGCGGMTAGFVAAGFDPIMAVEWDVPAAATYAANYGEDHIRCMDIAELRSEEVPKADVVIGGPPCQGFSNLGTKDPTDPRNKLWQEYLRVVLVADPKVFIIENVDRFSKSIEFALLMTELESGALKRWKHVNFGVLNAANYGVPQRRQRTILIASRVGPVFIA